MPKVYCVIDCYRNGRFLSFDDYNNDGEFIRTLYIRFPDAFGEIISSLYRSDDYSYDCGVNYYEYIPDYDSSIVYKISRRFDYSILSDLENYNG